MSGPSVAEPAAKTVPDDSGTAGPEGPHRFRDTAKMMRLSQGNWREAESGGLINLHLDCRPDGTLHDPETGRSFRNLSSYSYLGLNTHPAVVQGAIDALTAQGCVGLGITPTRMRPSVLRQAQDQLSEIWRAQCLLALSCSVATAGLLPLVSSGHLVDGRPRVTVFDKRSHFCMDYVKPICADEAPVLVAPHNDLDFVEDACKKYGRVAYVADGAYSMGGLADLDGLLQLQDRYGLFLWMDDSHAISVMGDRGEGYIRSAVDRLNDLTLITGSLEKGFGCSGGVVMLPDSVDPALVNTFAGPMCWSQSPSVANMGSVLAAARLHAGPELNVLQTRLRANLDYFDSRVPSESAGSILPVRALPVGDRDLAVDLSRRLLAEGFYCAPVYFPVTSRGREGLRVMMRANLGEDDLRRFVDLLVDWVVPHLVGADGAVAAGDPR
ncbi:aminotransferase class I/II-fold pyridoxal phosphate-dependent enzyme [Micromonospora sp. NPDC049240]|uniref:aminotransferase class I/II-fold pyridoxal phosphate-dependent enzyme n=1 Tax=Micromonospora sp. NPDC049240 TaxID=3155151 RepID=UPI0033FDE2F3